MKPPIDKIFESCPWRLNIYCEATKRRCDKNKCAVYHFVKMRFPAPLDHEKKRRKEAMRMK